MNVEKTENKEIKVILSEDEACKLVDEIQLVSGEIKMEGLMSLSQELEDTILQ